MRRLTLTIVLLLAVLIEPVVARADDGSSGGFTPHGDRTHVTVKVTSTPTGIYVQVNITESDPGSTIAPANPAVATPVTSTRSSDPSQGNSSSSQPSGDRVWSDATGIYRQTPDGTLYYLTIPNISTQSDWQSLLQQNPGKTPYALYINNQLQGFIWIPNASDSQPVQFGAPPANQAIPGPPPAGNGSSTDPYQVALSLLDHVPLPDIQIKENPALGLVNLPGWFWVEGYDGKPFGDSRTVTIPPAVGPDVPFTQVPKNDPRRQPTSFTVSVKVWPTSYQWSFGDGTSLDSQSIGQAYPAQSDIQHTYEYSSLKTANGFPIRLTVVFAAEFQVNGGGSQGLPPISHDYTAAYPVQEAQALLVSH